VAHVVLLGVPVAGRNGADVDSIRRHAVCPPKATVCAGYYCPYTIISVTT
jgi:hypothetical protein